MNAANPEFVLTDHYQSQSREYQKILALVGSSRSAMQNGDDTDRLLGHVHELIQATHVRDQGVTPIRDAWVASGNRPGPELARAIHQVEGLVTQILESVSDAEAMAKEAKSKLLPQLNQEAAARRMHSAYAAASSPSGVAVQSEEDDSEGG